MALYRKINLHRKSKIKMYTTVCYKMYDKCIRTRSDAVMKLLNGNTEEPPDEI